ncbi:ArsR/SmtB family transcription factor [Amycolatopsis sp. lyj-346]|uniref:ArsR/SmtB family transcription factor n=1 Tax=Amycolatopsis sp. lyj-346 TaxID=2789289 RepID=UPI00397DD0B9
MLRIHFTSEDLSRTRIAAAANPFWEMVFSRYRLAGHDRSPGLTPWLHRVRATSRGMRAGMEVLAALCPQGPYFPDFLTPHEGLRGLDAGAEAILSTPRRRVEHELARLAGWSPVPSWTRRLTEGEARARVVAALRAYHAAAIEPHADLIEARMTAERTRRQRDLARGGVAGLLRGLAPMMAWRPPVLEMPYPVDRDLHLDGRGLLLVPSYFCRRRPVALADPGLPPTVAYPVDQTLADPSLAGLLGVTRATVLTSIDDGATTTMLAHRVMTSPGSASRHTQVLREAGLITTNRRGTAVWHTLTPLGSALLSGNRARPGH